MLPRAGLLANDADTFSILYIAALNAGYVPVVSCIDPHGPADEDTSTGVSRLAAAFVGLPPGVVLMAPVASASIANALRGFDLDVLVVYRWTGPLPEEILTVPRLGVVRVHDSLLPRWRGPRPVEAAIRAGDPVFGVTVHYADDVDTGTGPILAQKAIPLPQDTDRTAVDQQLRNAAEDILAGALESVAEGESGTPQDESSATHSGLPDEDDTFDVVDPAGSRETLHNLARCHRYLGLAGPSTVLNGVDAFVGRTSLRPGYGARLDCGDGPLWITRAVLDAAPDACPFLNPSPGTDAAEEGVDVTAPPRAWTTREGSVDALAVVDDLAGAVYDVVVAAVARLGLVESPIRLRGIASLAAAHTARRLGLDPPVLTPTSLTALTNLRRSRGPLTPDQVRALVACARGLPEHRAAEALEMSPEEFTNALDDACSALESAGPAAAVATAYALGLLSEADHAVPTPSETCRETSDRRPAHDTSRARHQGAAPLAGDTREEQ
ncbi:methionyl-tRNA formyltransferase [Embleya sp. MST-111070]|uniref:methionyl-tRNA formyltransferase n=1 Tax=Embleya sp. MST-111070 TaxID=3398231 RepID=UPI003F73220C